MHEAYCLDSQFQSLLWWDDFLGDQLKDEWTAAGGAGGSAVVVDGETGGIVRITTDGDATDEYEIHWNNIRSLRVASRVSMEFRLKLVSATSVHAFCGLRFDGSNFIIFQFDASANINWLIYAYDAPAGVPQDSGIVADTSYHIFRIECHTHGGNHVHYYIDGVECGNSPQSVGVPLDALMPRFYCSTEVASEKSLDIDYVVVRQDR